jgi:hypothetical protein
MFVVIKGDLSDACSGNDIIAISEQLLDPSLLSKEMSGQSLFVI